MPFVRLAPALFVLLWATGFIGARYAMPHAEPFLFLSVRFAIAFVLLWVLGRAMGSGTAGPRTVMHAMIAGALIHGVYLGGVFWAIAHGMPAGLSALVIGLQPLITALLAGFFLGERISARHWSGLVIGLAGLLIVIFPKLGQLGSGVTAATLAASLAAVLAIAAGTIWQKRFVTGIDLVTGTTWQYVGAAVVTGLGALAFETGRVTLTGELVFAMVWLVFVLSIGAVFLLMFLIREGEVAKVASLFYLVPAVTALMAFFLFGETLSLIQVTGVAVTMVGVALATVQPPARERASR